MLSRLLRAKRAREGFLVIVVGGMREEGIDELKLLLLREAVHCSCRRFVPAPPLLLLLSLRSSPPRSVSPLGKVPFVPILEHVVREAQAPAKGLELLPLLVPNRQQERREPLLLPTLSPPSPYRHNVDRITSARCQVVLRRAKRIAKRVGMMGEDYCIGVRHLRVLYESTRLRGLGD